VAECVAVVEEDRSLSGDIERARDLIRSGALLGG
jgi:histidine ammonia-lyase